MPSVIFFLTIIQLCLYSMCALCSEWAFLCFFFTWAVNVTWPIASVRQLEDVIPVFCVCWCLTVNRRQRFMKLWVWQIDAMVKHPDAGGCRNSSWLTAMPRIGPAWLFAQLCLVWTATVQIELLPWPLGHSSMPALKTNLHKQKNTPWFLQTFALVGGLSSAPRPRVNTPSVSAGYK